MPRPAAISISPASTSPAPRRRSSKIGEAAGAARAAGMPVVFFQNGWDADYVEAGGPGSPNWHKSNALKTMRREARAAGQAAGQGRLGLRAGRGAAAAAGRHRPRQAALQRLLQHQLDSILRARGIRNAGLHRHRHQRLRRIDPARRLLPRIFRRRAPGRHPSCRARLHPAGLALQCREILRLGLLGRGFPRRLAGQINPTLTMKGEP